MVSLIERARFLLPALPIVRCSHLPDPPRCQHGLLVLGLLVLAVPCTRALAYSEPWALSANGLPASRGSRQGDGQLVLVAPGELSAALAAAGAGDYLELLPGSHPGPVRVDKRVQIHGRPGAIIQGNGYGTVLTLAADGIELDSVSVRGSGADLASDDAVILLLQAHGITVRNCRVAARAFGIYLSEGGGHQILDNTIEGDDALIPNRRGNGVHLFHTSGNAVVGNATYKVRDGIYLSFAHDNEIRANVGTHLRYGIHYMYSERNLLQGNRFSDGTGGIALMYSLDNSIVGNELWTNRDFGILCLQLERSTVSSNRLRDNGRGLVLQNSGSNQLRDNRIAGNGIGVYLTSGSEDNRLFDNRFTRNLVHVYRDHAGVNSWFEDGRGNYWGDYAGFDWNGDGIGDTPYRLQTAASALLARRPAARWFWMSPALALLDWWQSQLGDPDVAGLDPFPLMMAPEPQARPRGKDQGP